MEVVEIDAGMAELLVQIEAIMEETVHAHTESDYAVKSVDWHLGEIIKYICLHFLLSSKRLRGLLSKLALCSTQFSSIKQVGWFLN